jgi:hypothetical protein
MQQIITLKIENNTNIEMKKETVNKEIEELLKKLK